MTEGEKAPAPAPVKTGGILDRCPWPFIFFHDFKQGLRDKPTWITFTYIILWRCFKYIQKSKNIAGL